MSSNSWMPQKGRRSVTAGSSLTRALNARKSKGTAPAPKSLYLRDFYSFRYNFRPPSVDPGERGRIIVKKGKESTSVTVERPSTQPTEAHQWLGTEIPAKEWDCVLIYDEVSDTYTLEKLDSHMVLTHQHKPVSIEPIVPTPPADPPSKRAITYEEELERELVAAVGGDEDADGDDDLEEIVPRAAAVRQEEEEEEEEIPKPPSPPPKPARPTKSTTALALPTATITSTPSSSSTPKPRTSTTAARPKAAPSARPKKQKRELAPPPAPVSNGLSDADEEDLNFGRPTKRARPLQPPVGLALPTASTNFYTPPPPPPLPQVSRPSPPPPPPSLQAAPEPGSESDEEWDEVANVGGGDEDDFDIFGDAMSDGGAGGGGVDGDPDGEGEDIDINEFEREINLQMEEDTDDDFLAAVVEEAPAQSGVPKSLKELANGAGVAYASEDDYSSSEESDDD